MIAVIDYKAGNLTSVMKAFTHLGADARVTEDPAQVRGAERVVLPGVGHFAATARLAQTGLDRAIRDVIADGKPFLGICVGLQWLFEGSTEADGVPGLAAFPGRCARFDSTPRMDDALVLKVPHVGWNTLASRRPSRLLAGIAPDAFVYYTHSYYAPLVEDTVGVTDYAVLFTGAIERGNIFGVQFHPEKSAEAGLQVLRNFLSAPPAC